MKYSQVSEWANILIPVLMPLVSLYFFSIPSSLDYVFVPILFFCYVLNFRNIMINLFGLRLFFLLILSFCGFVGVFRGWPADLIARDLISLLPLFFVSFREKTNYLLIVKVIFFVSLLVSVYQIYLVLTFGGRAHYYYFNSMIPFCNVLFFYAVYLISKRRSYVIGATVMVVSFLAIASTGSKVNVLILVSSIVALFVIREARSLAAFLCLVMSLVASLAVFFFSEEIVVVERVLAVINGGDSSTDSRLKEVSLGLALFEGREVFGLGLGSTISMYGREILYFHLSPLYFFFKLGFVSIIFLMAYVYMVLSVVRLAGNHKNTSWYRFSILGAGVTLLVYILVFPSYKYIHMNIFLGLFLSMMIYAKRTDEC